MGPADNHVASAAAVIVLQKIAAGIFKFNADTLPPARPHFAHGLAIGEGLLHPLHLEPEPGRHHTEDIDDAELVDRLVWGKGDVGEKGTA